MKKQKLLIVGLLGLVALSGCKKPGSSSETSVSSSEVPSSVEETLKPGDTVWEYENAARTSVQDVVPENAANGVKNFAAASGEDRSEILGLLEDYTLDNFLGGIPYRDNSGFVLYNERLQIPADDYIVGYGFGVGEANFTGGLTGNGVLANRSTYYHTWNSKEPGTINYLDGQDSVTADLHAMVASGYWGTRMNEEKNGYVWYPLLANDIEFPIPLNADPITGMATKWSVPVKVGGDLVYDTLSYQSKIRAFKGQPVALDDYLTPFKLMIEEGWFRATDLSSRTSGFVGVAEELEKDLEDRDIANVSGIKLNTTTNAIEFEFLTAKTPFYAMYNLSSSLFSPIPLEFVEHIGADEYGKPNPDSILSLGVYTVKSWDIGKEVVFAKNETWIEADRYKFPGYVFTVLEDNIVAFSEFLAGNLDSAGVPSAQLQAYKDDIRARQTKGDTVWKLQTNAASPELWNDLFGAEGTVSPGSEWDLKPVMSNSDFLNGVYYSINRAAIAETTGSRPAQAFLSDAYMVDPESGLSWRESDAGKAVIEDRLPESHGFSKEAAGKYFNDAMDDLVAAGKYTRGTASSPTLITLQVIYQSQTQVTGEGAALEALIEPAFNEQVEGFKLDLKSYATSNWMDAYYAAMYGEFDFAFGSISGNTLDPIGFMETVSSDNRSGFTLSWGTDTSLATEDITFKGETYSFDALLDSAIGMTLVKDGRSVKTFTFDSLKFVANADITKVDLTATGTYYDDGVYVVEPDEEGTTEETGGFLSLVFYSEAGKFLDIIPLDVTTWEDGEWTVVETGIEIPEGAYYMDVYISTIHGYGGSDEFRANLYEFYW